jgi:hypothetical protein
MGGTFVKKLLLLFGVSILLIFQLAGCRTGSSVSVGLSFDDSILAKKVDDSWTEVKDTKFAKGDTIGLIILNVSGFKKGEDGLNWMDIDVEVKDSKGTVILSEKGLLGEAGKIALENNIAESPVGTFSTSSDMASGKYDMKVTVHDKIGGGKVSCSKSLYIE